MYKPRFLNWAKSFEQEVAELKRMIKSGSGDNKLLRMEYQQLTGKRYKSTIKINPLVTKIHLT